MGSRSRTCGECMRAAQRLGYQAVERLMGRFHLGHLPLVREAFQTAQCFVHEDSFLFPTTDAALSYYGSGLVDAIVDPPAGGEHRARLLALVGDEIDAIIRREGVFRVPQDSGCFVDSVGLIERAVGRPRMQIAARGGWIHRARGRGWRVEVPMAAEQFPSVRRT
ncbi:MAG: hypothetical protein M3069_20810 [Chloroflexota bacterium]|nr:hypothetical protein [Chloroflexota bacterium]